MDGVSVRRGHTVQPSEPCVMWGVECRVCGVGCRVWGVRFGVCGLGCGVWGEGAGLVVGGLGFKVWGSVSWFFVLGSGVWVLGFKSDPVMSMAPPENSAWLSSKRVPTTITVLPFACDVGGYIMFNFIRIRILWETRVWSCLSARVLFV